MSTDPFWVSAFLDLAEADHEHGSAFWAAVTGCRVSASRGATDQFATLVPPDGDDHLRVQRLGSGPPGMHLDLHVADPRAAADRAVALGASEIADHGYVVLTSPAGLRFCLVAHPASRRSSPVTWPGGRSQVDQVCLDVGPSSYDEERRFWGDLTGFVPSATDDPTFSRLDGAGPLRLLLQRLTDDRPAGFHLDLAADDRPAEVARHVELGATVTAVHDQWSVLVDPAGTTYCVTDRTPVPAAGGAAPATEA